MWYFFDTLLNSKIQVVAKPQKTFATYNLYNFFSFGNFGKFGNLEKKL